VSLRVRDIRQTSLVLQKLEWITRRDFGIQHSTIQPIYAFNVLDASNDITHTQTFWPGAASQLENHDRVLSVLAANEE
jgi:hypothetical protein